jgi:hypothetical protein
LTTWEDAMSDHPGNFSQLVDTFCRVVATAHESGTFAGGLCGPKCLLAQVLNALPAGPPDGAAARHFQAALATLDTRIASGKVPSVYQQDATLPGRWAALSQLVRTRFMEKSSADFGTCLIKAKDAFDKVWKEAKLGADPDSSSVADCTKAKAVDKGLFSLANDYLQPWTPGSWLAWDVLSQWNQTANPVAVETTPVLFAGGGQGQVMRLVVEALPGPPGLVTPNWWCLGLCAFDTGNAGRLLLPAVQRLIRQAAATAPGLRFRWHLDADQRDAWKLGLHGRSVEAAAAVATLAVLERHKESQDQAAEPTRSEPILDARAVVTALVGGGETSDLCDQPLEPVRRETLSAKLVAARAQGLDVVGVPVTQPLGGVVVPEGVRVELVATVGEAFDLVRAVNRAFDRYGEYVRSQFKYHEEETPADR